MANPNTNYKTRARLQRIECSDGTTAKVMKAGAVITTAVANIYTTDVADLSGTSVTDSTVDIQPA